MEERETLCLDIGRGGQGSGSVAIGLLDNIVTCKSIARERDMKMTDADSWKQARSCGINRRVHGYEQSINIFLGYRYAI
jgi:hypothetical protein